MLAAVIYSFLEVFEKVFKSRCLTTLSVCVLCGGAEMPKQMSLEEGEEEEKKKKMCATKMFSSNTPPVLVKIVYFKPSFLRYSILRKGHRGHRQQQCPCPGLLLHASHFSRSKPPAVGLSTHTHTRARAPTPALLSLPLRSLAACDRIPSLCRIASQQRQMLATSP